MAKKISHEDVVGAFNVLGYSASFGAVAARLTVEPRFLYQRYSSREALGEAWVAATIPKAPVTPTFKGAFSDLVLGILGHLDNYRDFSRSWLAALSATSPTQLPALLSLHDVCSRYFLACLDANQATISLPPDVRYDDVRTELADALCGISLFLVAIWEIDRSLRYSRTTRTVLAVGYVIEGLLIRRPEFGDAGLLVHLHELLRQPHDQFLKPLLDLVMKPERAGRLADPVSLLELLRDFRSLPARRY